MTPLALARGGEDRLPFDAAVLQLYSDPQLLFDAPLYFKQVMRSYGIEKPVWINETNAVPWDDPASPLARMALETQRAEWQLLFDYCARGESNAL